MTVLKPTRLTGVVLVISLIAALPLSAMVFYVINHGRQVNARIVIQHAADSAALAGTGWIARSFNTVAMNNVTVSRMLAVVNTLDAVPLSALAARGEQTALRDALAARHETIEVSPSTLEQLIGDQMQRLLDELNDEVAVLEPFDDFLKSSDDVSQMTHYSDGQGQLWQAMESMDQLSQATMNNLGDLSQQNAVHGGEVNLDSDRAPDSATFMLPVSPQIPWKRGQFNDFERPVRFGLLPGSDDRLTGMTDCCNQVQVDDKTTNRGPYDTIFGWRHITRQGVEIDPDSEPPNNGGVDTGQVPNPFGGGPGSQGAGTLFEYTAYRNDGTQEWILQRVSNFNTDRLYFSRFSQWTGQVANAKLQYVWPGTPLQQFALPDWNNDYPNDIPPDRSQPVAYSETAWLRLDIKSAYERGHNAFLSPGSWAYEEPARTRHDTHARVNRCVGWWLDSLPTGFRITDPMQINDEVENVKATRIGTHAWLYEYQYHVLFDNEIGLPPIFDEDDNPVPQTAYFIQTVIYAGVNRNPIRAGVFNPGDPPNPSGITATPDLVPMVVNPYDGFDPTADNAPSPTDFDHTQVDSSNDDRREYLTFLAIARRGDRAMFWPSRFDANNPYPGIVALAQAHVFNNHSWDLWTQMWHAQLQPVDLYDQWLSTMEASTTDADESVLISLEQYEQLHQLLTGLEPLEQIMLAH